MTESHLASTPTDLADKRQALILIAEDEPEIADILSAYLKRSGFQTAHALDGRRALELHQSLKPDLVLLDVLMPNLDGWMVLAEIRHRGTTPVIMLTAQDQDMDKLMGLRIGADDYIVKPFNPAEVVARTQAVLRRSLDHGYATRPSVLRVNAFEIDIDSHEVSVQIGAQKHPLNLTVTEFRLLAQLAKAPSAYSVALSCWRCVRPRVTAWSARSTAISASCGAKSKTWVSRAYRSVSVGRLPIREHPMRSPTV